MFINIQKNGNKFYYHDKLMRNYGNKYGLAVSRKVGKHKFYAVIGLCESFVNLTLSIIFVRKWMC